MSTTKPAPTSEECRALAAELAPVRERGRIQATLDGLLLSPAGLLRKALRCVEIMVGLYAGASPLERLGIIVELGTSLIDIDERFGALNAKHVADLIARAAHERARNAGRARIGVPAVVVEFIAATGAFDCATREDAVRRVDAAQVYIRRNKRRTEGRD